MRWLLGIFLLVAAGCTTPEGRSTEPVAPLIAAPTPPTGICVPRLGIEFLSAELTNLHRTRTVEGATVAWPTPAPLRRHGSTSNRLSHLEVSTPIATESPAGIGAEPSEERRRRGLWTMSETEIHAIDSPVEQLTLQFVNNVISEDNRRVHRRIGAPILHNAWRGVDHQGFESQLDQRDREDQVQTINSETRSLVYRAFRKAIRKSSYVEDVSVLVDDFKASAVPFNGAYDDQDQHQSWGRMSLRWRLDDSDPLEATYINNGWRIGSGAQRLKLGYGKQLSRELWIGVRTSYYYELQRLAMFGDLRWEFSPESTCHVLVGDRIDILTSTGMYPVISSPYALRAVDDSSGVLFYVEHLF